MISTSIMRSTGEKKCTPMNCAGRFDSSASDVIGSVRRIGAEDHLVADHGLRLGDSLGLDLAVLEHRLDDQIAVLERAVVGRGRDAREQRLAVGRNWRGRG